MVVKFSDNAVKVVKKFYELDKQIKELIDDSERDMVGHMQFQAMHWNWIKWYDDDEAIMAFIDMLDQIGDENFGMIRLGEEDDDIEELFDKIIKKSNDDCDLNCSGTDNVNSSEGQL